MGIDTLSDLLSKLEKTSFSKIEIKIDDAYINLQRPDTKLANDKLAYIASDEVSEEDAKKSLIKEIDESDDIKTIKSPMVGVFYRSANPDEDPFVKEGDIIKKGETVGIIEAMKLMNEIVSDFDGEVVEVCCKDKTNIGYGEPIMKIKIK